MLVQVDIQAVPNVLHLCQGRMAGWWGGAHQMRMVVCCCAQSLRNNPPGYCISPNNSCCAESERYLESHFGNTEFKDILRSWFCMECLFPVEICNFQWNGDVIFIWDSSSSIECFILYWLFVEIRTKHAQYVYNVTIDIQCCHLQSAQRYDVTPCKELTSGARSGGRLQGLVTELGGGE